jgi:type IV pilus assembly protein PilY1
VGAENAKVTRRGPDGIDRVALFGSQTGTPAIATVQANPDGTGSRQIGVVILPGGIDGPPVKNQMCARASGPIDRSDPLFPPRAQVRAWGANCGTTPVPGRGVTIVRADTGEIIRHFGRRAQDVPQRIWPRTTDTPFDSPMVGTPLVFPNTVGAISQRVYIGDADGTLWMIDISKPDPVNWQAYLMQDLVRTAGFAASQPIIVPPVVSIDPTGQVIINAATGDLENIVSSTIPNYVYSIREEGPNSANGFIPRGQVRWITTLPNGERVTGPMVVFDRTLYFATHAPEPVGTICAGGAAARLWGVDFFLQATPGNPNGGPAPRWCPIGSTDPVTGVCGAGAYLTNETIIPVNAPILPGVTLRATLPCTTFGAVLDDPTGGITGIGPATYSIETVNTAGPPPGPGQPLAPSTLQLRRPPPTTPSSIDAWAIVTD